MGTETDCKQIIIIKRVDTKSTNKNSYSMNQKFVYENEDRILIIFHLFEFPVLIKKRKKTADLNSK